MYCEYATWYFKAPFLSVEISFQFHVWYFYLGTEPLFTINIIIFALLHIVIDEFHMEILKAFLNATQWYNITYQFFVCIIFCK